MKNNWSEISNPKEGVSYYTHIVLETPIGRAIIEWKGWKDRDDDKAINIGNDYIGCESTLENAKQRVMDYLMGKKDELDKFINQ